jgi:hypothetical protein
MVKKLFLLFTILCMSFSLYAQNVEGVNARIDAMGGCGVIGDIGWTVGKPCKINAYPNNVQASAVIMDLEGSAQTYGQIIAIKSFGDHFFAGLTMNDKRAMSGTFYKVAMYEYGFLENFQSMKLGRWFPNWPHLNLCLKPNDNFVIGLGGFFEHSKYEEKKRKEFRYNYVDPIDSTKLLNNVFKFDSTITREYIGFGVNIDAMIWFGESGIKLNPEFRAFFPKLDGDRASNCADNFDTSHNIIDFKIHPTSIDTIDTLSTLNVYDKAQSTDLGKNYYLRAGTKLSGTIGETFWIGGVWYKSEQFELKRDSIFDSLVMVHNAKDTMYSRDLHEVMYFKKTCFDWWLGCQPSFSDNLIFCPEYSGGVYFYNKEYPLVDTRDTSVIVIKHKFRMGVEGSIKNFWIFKELLPRFGLTFTATREISDYQIFDSGDSTLTQEDISWPYITNWDQDLASSGKGAKVSAGFGVRGKRSTLDLSFDVLEWREGAIVGPQAAIVTFTLNLAKKLEE